MKRWQCLSLLVTLLVTLSALDRGQTPQPRTMQDCPLDGWSKAGKYDKELDKQKNRSDKPNMQHVVALGFADMVAMKQPATWPKNSPRGSLQTAAKGKVLKEGSVVSATGYLWKAKRQHKESCNCELDGNGAKGQLLTDIHMVMTNDPNETDETNSFTAEITPRVRAYRPNPNTWIWSSIQTFNKKYIRVTGYLMLDTEHLNSPNPPREKSWEVHPVMKLEVCTSTRASCDKGKGWVEVR